MSEASGDQVAVAELDRELDWETDGAPAGFRALSYWFTVTAEDDGLLAHTARVLGGLRVPRATWAARQWPLEQQIEAWRLERGVEDYAVWRGAEQLYRGHEPGDVLDHFLWAVNQRVIERARDFYLIHAAVLCLPSGGAVLLPGEAGSGKSSLTVALAASGLHYMSDELAAIDPISGRVYPYPKAATLKPGSYDLFAHLLATAHEPLPGARQRHLTTDEMGTHGVLDPHDVRAVVFPQFTPEGETGTVQLTTGQLAHGLARHSLSLEMYGARGLPLLVGLARGATGLSMRHRDLDEAVSVVTASLQPTLST